MLADWLGAGPLVVNVLKGAIPSLKEVQVVSSLIEAQMIAEVTPSCFVAWSGDTIEGCVGTGRVTAVSQRWSIILATEPGKDAGALLSSIITALAGTTLSDDFDPLHYAGGAGAVRSDAFVFSTLYFSAAVIAG